MTEAAIRARKGMKTVKEMPLLQDGPPPGGFPAVRYARNIPNTGPSGTALVLGATLLISWGFYRVGQGNIYRRGLKKEKMDARKAILPVIQAEEDARYLKERQQFLDEETKIMSKVPGWKAGESVYSSGRWMPPSTGRLTQLY
eukprot:SM000022S07168  [mRNA]  locus=s22:359726:360847:+ [translate_table: standard]